MKLTGAQIVIKELLAHGVDTVFGYPGGAVLDLYDELYKNRDQLTHIKTVHEQAACHAADGYARATGKTGVVIATSGPGATNLVTGIATAYLDSTPLIAITGNVAVPYLGRDSFQEVDIVGITQAIVKHSFIVHDVNELQSVFCDAFAIARSGRPGPVLIDIPKSVQTDLADYDTAFKRSAANAADELDGAQFKAALDLIRASQRPVIYSGGGTIAAQASAQVIALAERIDAPIILSLMGLSAIPASHSHNLRMCGMHGNYAASTAQANCDLMIVVGSRFSDRATGDIDQYRRHCKVIHLEIDHAEVGKNVNCDVELVGDAKQILNQLLEQLSEAKKPHWLAQVKAYQKVDDNAMKGNFTADRILQTLNAQFDDDTVVTTDVGQHQMWTSLYYLFEKPRTFLTSGGLGTMGFGFGAAIGASIGRGRKTTLFVTSEGSFAMNMNELATAVREHLPIVIVLLNNGALGMVRQWQNIFYGKRFSETTLDEPVDYVKLADAFGANAVDVASIDALKRALLDYDASGPLILNCEIDKDEMVYPMIPPGKSIDKMIVR